MTNCVIDIVLEIDVAYILVHEPECEKEVEKYRDDSEKVDLCHQ